MMSTSLNIKEFLTEVALCGFREIILKTNQEATEAERNYYKCRLCSAAEKDELFAYSTALKDFIVFMRYGVKSRRLTNQDLTPFGKAREENMTWKPRQKKGPGNVPEPSSEQYLKKG